MTQDTRELAAGVAQKCVADLLIPEGLKSVLTDRISDALSDALRAAREEIESIREMKLSCDVLIAPATCFRKGVTLDAVIVGLEARQGKDIGPIVMDRALLLERIAELEKALREIACFDDVGANIYLEANGSFAAFDEPGSVQIARATLSPAIPAQPGGEE